MSDSKLTTTAKPKISRVEVYWHTVTYKTVALYVIVITAIVVSATYLVFPEASASLARHISDTIAPHERAWPPSARGKHASSTWTAKCK